MIFVIVAAFSLLPACHHVASLTPAQNLHLSIDQALDILANSANGAEKAAYQLEAAKLISTATARDVGNYSKETALVAQKALAINQSGETPQQKATEIIALLQTIKQLPASVQTFVANPNTNGTVQSLVTLVQTIVKTAQALIASQGGS